jgi:glycosyltransferase involved in cell wall biosynthesis
MSAAERLRVLQVITGLAAGGAEEQLRLLAPRLAERGVDCEVAAFYHVGQTAALLRADGIRVHELNAPTFGDPRATLRLIRLIRARRYDLVHTHLFRAGLHGRLAARLAGVRAVVHTEHSLNPRLIEGRERSRTVETLYRGGERLGTLTLAVSTATARQVGELGVRPERIRILPCGIDTGALRFDPAARRRVREQQGYAPDDLVVACVGRLVPAKRFHVAVEAVARLAAEEYDRAVRLVVIGTGPQHPELQELAAQRLAERALFTGELPPAKVAAWLAAADLFASPSPEETFGLSVLSALATGLPTVYADCPALDSLPQAHDQYRRAPSEPAAFHRALAELAARDRGEPPDREPGPAIGAFDIEDVADRLAAIYRELRRPAAYPIGNAISDRVGSIR